MYCNNFLHYLFSGVFLRLGGGPGASALEEEGLFFGKFPTKANHRLFGKRVLSFNAVLELLLDVKSQGKSNFLFLKFLV